MSLRSILIDAPGDRQAVSGGCGRLRYNVEDPATGGDVST